MSSGRLRRLLGHARRLIFLVLLAGSVAGSLALYRYVEGPLPAEAPPSETSYIYDAKGNQIALLFGDENREVVKLDQIPKIVVDAVLSSEDRNFYEHRGLDPIGLTRALYNDVRGDGTKQGGSTVTQQYVKLVYVGSERTVGRKAREALLALKIEHQLTKQEILERYLNLIYFGRGASGVQAAARAFFGKDIKDVTAPQEAALLAGVLSSPSDSDPSINPERAKTLRDAVLGAMAQTHAITETEATEAQALPLGVVEQASSSGSSTQLAGIGAEYFIEYVRRELIDQYGAQKVLEGGLRVHTTLDPDAQRAAYEAAYSTLDRPEDPSVASVTLDNQGRVVAMVGGRDFGASKVNLAVGAGGGGVGRQAGSTFKPFVLTEIVKEGYSVSSKVPGPRKIVIPGANDGHDWEISNYDDADFGDISLVDATVHSVNTAYAQAVIGRAQKTVQTAHDMGVESPLQVENSIVLGTQNVSPLDMAAAYSTLSNRGMRIPPRVIDSVADAQGNDLSYPVPPSSRVLDENVADVVNDVLRQVVGRGSGGSAQVPDQQIAGKTGTTEEFGDAWFVGYTPYLTTAVWVGYPEGQARAMTDVHGIKVTGSTFPAQIFRKIMTQLVGGHEKVAFRSFKDYPGETFSTDDVNYIVVDTDQKDEQLPTSGGSTPGSQVGSVSTVTTLTTQPTTEPTTTQSLPTQTTGSVATQSLPTQTTQVLSPSTSSLAPSILGG